MCHDNEYHMHIAQAREWDEAMIALYGQPIKNTPFNYTEVVDPKWKYQLTTSISIWLKNRSLPVIEHPYFSIIEVGDRKVLTINKGYAWDGLTGFPDRVEWLLGSLVHDALIQGCELGLIPNSMRQTCHEEMRDILERTTSQFWANLIWLGLTIFHPVYWRIKSKLQKSSDDVSNRIDELHR